MFRRGLALCVVLGFASVANAAAVLELTRTDMGTVDADGNRVGFTDLTGPVYPGDQFMVHAWLTVDTALTSGVRAVQFDYSGPATTVPYDWLGVDADTNNQPIDTIPNFWFDYRDTYFVGRFPPQGQVWYDPIGWFSSTGEYTDFSNVFDENGNPFAVNTSFGGSSETANMFVFVPGVPYHVGAMVVTVPSDGIFDDYTLDLLNDTATDINSGAVIQFDFVTPTDWGAFNGLITYAQGAGPTAFTVIPEPATLLLLGLGGVAALRRRR